MIDYETLAEIALTFATRHGTTYADVRFVQSEYENIEVTNGVPELIDNTFDSGMGIRVIADGAWGFAATADATSEAIRETAIKAVEIAKASAKLMKQPVELARAISFRGEYSTPLTIDPFKIPLKEKLEYMTELCLLMTKAEGVAQASASMNFKRMFQYFASSEGVMIRQNIIHSGAGIECSAGKGHRGRSVRSYPNSSGGQFESKGYELIQELRLEENAPRIAQEAVALLSAKECPSGIKDIVLDGPMLSLQIHESIGHPLELDRVFGSERNFSGTSYATTEKLDKLKIGSELVNFVSDATAFFGLGTFGYDDEGVKARKVDLIKNGILVGYESSRETAARIGRESSGAARADGWGNIPIIRMTNTNLLPGKDSLEDLIAGVDDGIYMATVASWSIDDARESFTMGTEIGWEIKGGKLGEMIKSPSYSDETIRFWNSCDGIGGPDLYRIWGTPNCGKGQPAQNGRVAQGCSPARFRGVKVGG
ncbi:MAG: peptidase C69 [candidate division Zixibacteria bacterium CG_4_9_14_3_um_filter_46_8]|nr:MAG: peptidase C69 [candidate division Zixibacteria bacterium CG_4_9_14_3_um_filter_46_8]